PRVRIRRRRPSTPADVLSAEEIQVAAELAREQALMRADLARQAVETVGGTLERMREREQETARNNPELQPYLASLFEQSRQTLLRDTGDLLTSSPAADPLACVRRAPSRARWRQSASEPDERKDSDYGPA